MDLAKLKAIRAGNKSAITRLFRKIDELDPEMDVNESVQRIINAIAEKQRVLTDINDRILEETSVEDIENEITDTDEYMFDLQTKVSDVSKLINTNVQTTTDNQNLNQNQAQQETIFQQASNFDVPPVTSNTANHSHRLPKLDLPKFGGNILEWQSFWDAYETAVHTNGTLSESEKFSYLRAQLRDEALHTVMGFSLTNGNYTKALNLLKERYGQPHKIVQTYMQALVNIQPPTNTLHSLRNFYDKTETYVRGLESLGQTEESYGGLLVPVMLGKLPAEVKRNITRGHGSTDWNLGDLRRAIWTELNIMDAGKTSYLTMEEMQTSTMLTNTRPSVKNTARNTETDQRGKYKCPYCKGDHYANDCTTVTDPGERMKIVKRDRLCFNCLRRHKVSECRSKQTCKCCHKRHHSSLCEKKRDENTEIQQNCTERKTTQLHSSLTQERRDVLLKTAVAPVHGRELCASANILFDEGAQQTFITEEFAREINMQVTGKESVQLSGFGDTEGRVRNFDTGSLLVEARNGDKISLKVMVVPEIAVPITTFEVDTKRMKYLQGLKLAHPGMKDDVFNISLLIGADHYWDFVGNRTVRGKGPTAVESKLGYLLSGPVNRKTSTSLAATSMMHVMLSHREEEGDLEKFWEIENIGAEVTQKPEVTSLQEVMKNYQDSNIRLDDNKFIAKLPWKDDHPELPTNENIARKRTQGVIQRLRRDPKMLKMYADIISDQEKRGFIEKIDASESHVTTSRIHYIPHHPVKKESSTTPIRIVYDCSCRQNAESPSLNDCLSSSPPQLNKLTDILTRFRLGKYAITSDIEKAFLQIELDEEDRDATRFFWLSDPSDPESRLETYRFKVLLFGATCSPFILNATLLKHLSLYPNNTSDMLQRDLYVDNVLTSVDTEEGALDFYMDSRELLSSVGFNLRTWKSNSEQLCNMAARENVLDGDTETKILGMRWNANSDILTFARQNDVRTDNSQVTKREILRQSSSIYDPLGILSPVTIRAKLLIQKLWKEGYDWDEVLPDNIVQSWREIRNDVRDVTANTKLSRHYFAGESSNGEKEELTLHVFVDASKSAYGASAYICKGKVSSLVIAKNRVAPLKEITLPKLELMAAVVGARIGNQLRQNLGIQRTVFWSDSQIVLHWLSSSKSLGKFTKNRINEIKDLTQGCVWRYVPTESNPADLQTRGISSTQFKNNSLWNHGPAWITDESSWPTWCPSIINTVLSTIIEQDTEEKRRQDDATGISHVMDIRRFSSMQKLLRVTCLVLKFISACKNRRAYSLRSRVSRIADIMTSQNLRNAEEMWIADIQAQNFLEDIQSLHTGKLSALARQLRLFYDNAGIIRCEGRIHNSALEDSAKYPILLPKHHPFTDLIVRDAHSRVLHAGTEQTITSIRQTYWIPAIRQCVNRVLRCCVKCQKVLGRPFAKPNPPPLPKDRVRGAIPFVTTGIDFAGPLYVKDELSQKKMYICLFTCACVRAVHLELIPDLSLESFVLGFRRFISSKGTPRTIYSDNAATFISASREIPRELNIRIDWKFNPKCAPWYGGWWERLIGLTKITLKKVLGRALVNEDTLKTVIREIELVINDRPLTHVSSDIRDPEPLTPSHLLCGRRLAVTLDESNAGEDRAAVNINAGEANRSFARKMTILDHFKQRWMSEYLTGLREFHRAHGRNNQTVNVGDVVQIQDDNPRVRWKLGVIQRLITGNDGLVRAVELRTAGGLITNRPIAKLYPLEL